MAVREGFTQGRREEREPQRWAWLDEIIFDAGDGFLHISQALRVFLSSLRLCVNPFFFFYRTYASPSPLRSWVGGGHPLNPQNYA
ncbi:MAG: hypothetical protein RLY97_2062 [Pseudomonadota bacterium]|jgi:hypothetical protein